MARFEANNDTVFRVQSPDLVALGFRPGDPFRILPLPFDQLFENDLVAAVINGYRCMGRLKTDSISNQVKLTVPLPHQTGNPARCRTYSTQPESIIGLVLPEKQPGPLFPSGH